MKKIIYLIILSLLVLYNLNTQSTIKASDKNKVNLVVDISGLDTNKGKVVIALFNERCKDAFPDNFKNAYKVAKVSIKDNSVKYVFENIRTGYYAIAVHHDENSNDIVDIDDLGVPTEGFVVSGNSKNSLILANYSNSEFKVTIDGTSIKIIMKYF